MKFNANTMIDEALVLDPRAKAVFERFGLNQCVNCCISRFETIGQVCLGHELNVDEFLKELDIECSG